MEEATRKDVTDTDIETKYIAKMSTSNRWRPKAGANTATIRSVSFAD